MNPIDTCNLHPFPINLEIVKETVHQWDVNDCQISLIKKQDTLGQDSLEYKIVYQNNEETYVYPIEIPEGENIEETISFIKTCKISIGKNGNVNFLENLRTWESTEEIPTTEINLVSRIDGLVWNVFQRITRENSFYQLQKVTIPSIRCHPKTIALIEKIKTGAFSDPNLLCCLMSDFNVRIIDSETIPEEFKELETELTTAIHRSNPENELMIDATKHQRSNLFNHAMLGVVWGLAKPSVLSINDSIISHAREVASRMSKIYLAGVAISCLPFIFYRPFLDRVRIFTEKKTILQERIRLLFSKPLFIEVEPISMPSAIDERVRISKFTWAVTLVTHTGCFGNHAQVIIEGINDGFFDQDSARIKAAKEVKIGEKFIHLADFSPKIEYGLLSPDELKYETRTETWMRSSDQVKKMLEAIEETKYRPKDNLHPFNFFGIRSKLYKFDPDKFNFSGEIGDNCFTFLREKLKMIDIDVGESYVDFIAAIVKVYTKNKEEFKDFPVQVMI